MDLISSLQAIHHSFIHSEDLGSTNMEGDSSSDEDGREKKTAEATAEKAEATEQADRGSRR